MSEERKAYKIEGRTPTIYRVVKNKDNPYVMIDRRPVDNPALSFKAKGILTYLLSRPDGWEVSVADLIKHGKEGEGAVRSGLKELKLAGHMKYTKSRNQGRITGWLIEVFEIPQSPDRDFQDVDNPDVENRGQVLSTLSNKKKTSNIKEGASATPKPPTPPEVTIFREVTSRYPNKVNYPDIEKILQSVSVRLLRPCTAEDLRPFFAAWTARGFNPLNIAWMGWAVTGIIPEHKQKTQPTEPRGFDAVRRWVSMQGEVVNNG